MARIRTIKPEFFRHEALQDLEIANPGMYPMMVFAGLWGHCDSKGRFEWRPRQLKLDILPFLPFDMAKTLALLESVEMLIRYEVDGKEYGQIPSFEKHQRLSGKEASEGERHPEPTGKQRGSTGEIPGSTGEIQESQEGKGKEGKRKGKGTELPPRSASLPASPPEFPDDDSQPETDLQAACRETWRAYSLAYADRYDVDPVRNAKTNAAVKGFVKRLGFADAPQVAAFFVGHQDAFYVRKGHDPGVMLADAEKLRTEWATGRSMSATRAQQIDRTSANLASHTGALAILESKGLA